MSNSFISVLIPARNAAATVARAVRSATAAEDCKIILLDHGSADRTVTLARGVAGERLTVVSLPPSESMGSVRQAGLDALDSEFGVWLDADDELIPGRCERLVALLADSPADLAFDEVDLHDGRTGCFVRRLAMPAILRDSRDLVRCFERNFLPGPGVPAFRTAFARGIGYDAALHGAEDYDFLLRAIVARARVCLVREPLYRQFSSEGSLSRQLENQRRMCALALAKHDPGAVEAQLREAGFCEWICAWTMVSFSVFRGEYGEALERLERFDAIAAATPASTADRWRIEFQRGTLLLLLGRIDEAVVWLRRAERRQQCAEGANNLGVALAHRGDRAEAAARFEEALRLFPGYRDALLNRDNDPPSQITWLPLRRDPARSDYP